MQQGLSFPVRDSLVLHRF